MILKICSRLIGPNDVVCYGVIPAFLSGIESYFKRYVDRLLLTIALTLCRGGDVEQDYIYRSIKSKYNYMLLNERFDIGTVICPSAVVLARGR